MSWPPQSINKSLPNAKSIFFNLPKPTPCLPDVFLTVISLLFFISSTKRNPSFAKFLPFVSSDRRRFLKIPSMSHSRPPFANPQALSDWLKPRLPSDLLASWGVKPGTKNVHNLWLELSEGETSLVDSSPPLRTVNVVTVRLMGKDDLVLVESRQQLSDGSFRDRFRPLSEKMKPNETVEEAVARAVKEELGSVIDTGSVRIVPGSYIKKLEERNSASYPGLPARYVLHSVDAWVEGLPEEDFCTDEQEEYQDLNGTMELEKAVSKQVKALEEERDSMIIEEEDSLRNYYSLIQQYKSLKNDIRDIVFSPKYCLPYMKSGRPICIQCIDDETSTSFSVEDHVTWGVLMDFHRVKSVIEDDACKRPEDASYALDILTRCNVSKDGVGKKKIKIVPLKEPGEPLVVSIPLSQVTSLSSARLNIPKDLLPLEARENALKKLSEFISRYATGMPLDPEEMDIQSNSYKKAVRRLEALENLFEKHEIAKSPLIEQKLKLLNRKEELTARIRSIKKTMRSSTALAFKDELKARKRVLRRLGYITSDDVVELKGKVACEISSADELTLTELMFSGVLKDVKAEEMVSLLSCFVWQEKLQDAAKPRDELELLFTQLQDTARRIAKVQLECKVQIDVESFVSSFRPDIMEAVYAWAKGSKFYEIMEITQVFEGSLIRAIRRLEEVLQQLILAARSIGETELETKFEEAVSKIKRDIVFAASLYL